MDINFKDILKKLSVFKNNMPLLISIIVALISIVLFVPTQLLSAKLKSQMRSESVSQWDRIAEYNRDPVEPVTPESLAQRKQAHAADANAIIALAEQTTMRELLSYDIFPEPDPNKGVSGLTFVEFGRQFRSGIDKMIRDVNGGTCPTQVEIENHLQDSAARMNRRPGMGIGMPGDIGDPYSMTMAPRRLGALPGTTGYRSEIDRMIIDNFCEDRARSLAVYVNPIDIAGYEHWADYKFDPNMVKAITDTWYHQLSYWVIEDIFKTIKKMNAGRDILSAPVKRFQNISFTMGLKRPGSRRASTAVIRAVRGMKSRGQDDQEEADRPFYVIEDRDGLTESLTARYSTEESAVDVIHFSLSVVVANKDVLWFLQELCSAKEHQFRGYPDGKGTPQAFRHNQITVLEMKSGAVYEYSPDHVHNRYGDESVSVLDLICEYVFNRKGYESIKPQVVKDTLAGTEGGV
ncbi:MAG: hypothetical protein JSW59_17860 [Phycisphaerales bacterium]|nr:MAG: hypothetical protein JSW59_17860 [Phycisphaerales bacterium]